MIKSALLASAFSLALLGSSVAIAQDNDQDNAESTSAYEQAYNECVAQAEASQSFDSTFDNCMTQKGFPPGDNSNNDSDTAPSEDEPSE